MRPRRSSLLAARAGSTVRVLAGVLAATLVTASCSSAADPAASGGTGSPVAVVASTNVWGDIAAQIGGSRVGVHSLISDPSQDPHSFQPSGRDELAVSRAAVVIENGGGYDDVVAQMVQAVHSDPVVVTATDAARKAVAAAGDDVDNNEHVWFDLDAVTAVAGAIAGALASVDPAGRADYRANLATFTTSMQPLRDAVRRIRSAHAGAPVAITEPLPLYLTQAAGLRNVTPPEFSEAVEEGIDVTPTQLAQTLALFTTHQVAALLYNEQSTGAQTDQVLHAAKAGGVPVVGVSELLPRGQHYQGWMDRTIGELAAALDHGAST
jgi:zinc/manganese transport system substrate-binding protein